MNVIGIDIGGTKVNAGLFSPQGHLLHSEKCVLNSHNGLEVVSICRKMLIDLLAINNGDISSVGVCVPGIVNPDTGRVWAPNIEGWSNEPLAEKFIDVLPAIDTPVIIENDRTASLKGEWWCGAAKGFRNVVFVAVGTGIGAGIMTNGVIIQGAGGGAGSMGWFTVGIEHNESYSHSGCYEYYAAGPGIVSAAQREIKLHPAYVGPLKTNADGCLTTPMVFDAYDSGDTVACAVIDNCIRIWGIGAANIVSMLDPDIVIFGGGVFGPAARYMKRIEDEARRWAQPINMRNVRFAAARMGSKAALYGAARCALDIVKANINS